MESLWTSVDEYFIEHLAPPDDVLRRALEDSAAAGMPPINVTANQGKLLQLLAGLCGARRILEVGTLAGYSTIWLARALPADGLLVTLEINPEYAAVAWKNLERAGVCDRVQLRVAPAADTLAALRAEGVEPFDLVFIDADKASSDSYFLASLDLSRNGTVIIVDNVVRGGRVIDSATTDADLQGIRRLIELLSRTPSISATAVQTVGSKGHDGLVLALVTDGGRASARGAALPRPT